MNGMYWLKASVVCLIAVFSSVVSTGTLAAGVITYVPVTNDADSEISSANVYTHLLDFGTNDAGALVNGVQFRRSTASDLPANFTYTVNTGSRSDHPGNDAHNVSGSVVSLFRDFVYNGNNAAGGVATLGVSGLVPGNEYDLRIYTRAWGAGTRVVTLGFDSNDDGTPNDSVTIHQDNATMNPPGFAASNQAYAISYRFTAESPVLNVTLTQAASNQSWHLYGVSNQVLNPPTWTGAAGTADWGTAGNWSPGDVPDGAGAIAALGADGAAAAVNLGSAGRTVGHLALQPAVATTLSTTGGNALTMDNVLAGAPALMRASGTHTINAPLVLNSHLSADVTGQLSVHGIISDGVNGPARVTKSGTGTLALTRENTYAGGTTVEGGAVHMGTAGAIGTGQVSIAGGANVLLWWNSGSNIVTNNFTLNGLGAHDSKTAIYADGGGAGYSEYVLSGTITLAATSNLGGHNINHLRVTGRITGPGGLTKGGGRTDENNALILTNTGNDFAGDTTISKGTLRLGASGVIPDGAGRGNVVVQSGATFDLAGFNETINGLSGGGVVDTIAGGAPRLTVGGNNATSTFSGTIRNSAGTLALEKIGTGTLVLSGGNTYSGGTTIAAGTLQAEAANATGSGAVTVASAATWDLRGHSHTVAGLSGAGNVTRSTINALTTGADGAALISPSKNYVHKLDFGNGEGATVNGVAFQSAGTSGPGWALTGAGSLYGESGSPTGYAQLISDFYYNGNPGVLTFTDLTVGQYYDAVLYTQVGSWTGRPQNATFQNGTDVQQLLSTDPGTVGYYSYRFLATDPTTTITMAPTTTHTFHWFGTSLELPELPVLTIGDSSHHAFSGTISGMGGLVKQGSGTQTLTGTNTYSGTTIVAGGRLRVGAPEVIPHGSGTGGLTVDAGAALEVAHDQTVNSLAGDGDVLFTGAVTGPVYFTTDAETGISADKTYTHALDFFAGWGSSPAVATINGVAFTNAGTSGSNWSGLPASATGNTSTGMADDGGMHELLKDFHYGGNPAVVTLSGLTAGETYELRLYNRRWGGNRFQEFVFDEDGAGPIATVLVFDQDATTTPSYIGYRYTAASDSMTVSVLPRVAGNTYHFYGLTNEVVPLPSLPTFTVGDAASTVFSGAISGFGNLTKQGTGTLTLTGASTYSGATTIDSGTLMVNGSLGNTDVAINDGGTLGGTGTIGGTVTVHTGGTHAPGASVGSQAVGGATWMPGGTFEFEINDAVGLPGESPGWDAILVAGTLDLTNLTDQDRFLIDIVSLAGTAPGPIANFVVTQPYEWPFLRYDQLEDDYFSPDLFTLRYAKEDGLFHNDIGRGSFTVVQMDIEGANWLAIGYVPEPGSGLLLLSALAGALLLRRRKAH
ncbi:MAG: autotransporter-associated beta strand repeat-containing protein [Thermoguttaceae bacterium]|jgi:autotransporter-associated beta strand protein|nr:autotransporter-associated beta strand repeat-containing protein [Thermoguttaceae bacterium]